MVQNPSDRLRPHPEQRYAIREQRIDLREAEERLLREPTVVERGHKEIALYHQDGSTTVALFHFDAGASLRQHKADGEVFIHVLEGRVTVTTDQAMHDLPAKTLLALAPRVPHDLQAQEASRVMVTVCLVPSKANGNGPSVQAETMPQI